jgi:drug/metabolite transporter (DMT)-like permease
VAVSRAKLIAAFAAWVFAASAIAGELGDWSPAEVTARAWLSLAFLVLCGTVLAFAAYTWLLRVTTPAAVGTYAFVNPLVALALAWAVGDETPNVRALVAAALVLGAVFLARGEKHE